MSVKVNSKQLVAVLIFCGLFYAASIVLNVRPVHTVEVTHSGVITRDVSLVKIYEMELRESNVPYEIETLENGSKQITWDIKYSAKVEEISLQIDKQAARKAGQDRSLIELEESGQYPFNNQ